MIRTLPSLLATRGSLWVLLVLTVWGAGCGRGVHVAPTDATDAPRIELTGVETREPRFEVVGLSHQELAEFEKRGADDHAAPFRVFVAGGGADAPPVLGTASTLDGRWCFVPRYPLEPGVTYRAVLRHAKQQSADGDVTAEFTIPRPPPHSAARITHIYPSSDELPENQLKFYIHFSEPMSRGDAYRHVHLLDGEGRTVEAAFLELGEELWDADLRRFTLLCDPGRVKRGLKPREEAGPVLEAGKRYTLVVDRDWPDALGEPLAESAKKQFHVVAPDDTPIDPAGWKIEPPPAGGQQPLVVKFGEPLEHALLERMVWVVDHAGQKLAGSIETTDDERTWRFVPARAWVAGSYQLVADTDLEDLAGNAIGRAFDADVFDEVQKHIVARTAAVEFTIPPAADAR